MNILLLGGTGFLGPYVVRQLVDLGHDVTIFHTGEHEPDLPPEVRHVHNPFARRPMYELPTDLRDLRPDVVVHMVPMTARDAQAAVDTFSGHAGRLVAISSQDVYRAFGRVNGFESGPPDPIPITEDSPLRERHYPYRGDTSRDASDPSKYMDDYDKILVERAVMSAPDMPGTVLRLPMIHGPGDRQHRLFPFLKRMDDRRPAILLEHGFANWRAPRGYVENVAHGIALAATDPCAAGRTYNVAEQEALSTLDWVKRIAPVAGWHGEIVVAPEGRMPPLLASEHQLVVDSSRIRRELGYAEIISQDEALKRTIAWERANPPAELDPADFDYAAEDEILAELRPRA
jgi:nucleoside-diphosphate-sugar epimerase